jgi:hypothetical protein
MSCFHTIFPSLIFGSNLVDGSVKVPSKLETGSDGARVDLRAVDTGASSSLFSEWIQVSCHCCGSEYFILGF